MYERFVLFAKTLFSSDSQSELSLASQEELTEVINFLSGAPIKLRLLSDDDTNPSMADSHMTPVDSGLGSIYSVALSNITQPSSAAPCASEKTDNKESIDEVAPSCSQSETKERATTPEVHSSKDAEPSMVTIETQTSPSSELCPVLLVKSADSDSKEEHGCPSPASDGRQKQPSNKEKETNDEIQKLVLPENDSKQESDDEKSITPQPVSPSQAKHDAVDVIDTSPDSVSKADTPKLSVGNDEQTKANKTASPVFVTVSSEECDGDNTVSISESLR